MLSRQLLAALKPLWNKERCGRRKGKEGGREERRDGIGSGGGRRGKKGHWLVGSNGSHCPLLSLKKRDHHLFYLIHKVTMGTK